jgi:hypothetical protein
MDNGYRVVCGIQVENWTKYPFSNPMTTLQWGYLSCPGTTVQPATREAIVCYACSIFVAISGDQVAQSQTPVIGRQSEMTEISTVLFR